MPRKPETIDEYLAPLSPERRAALQRLRKTIRSLVPDAEECISYSMPAFRYRGRVIAGFLATSRGYSYFPFSGTTLGTLSADLAAYDRTKSALHFDPKRPLPRALVRRLLTARIAETKATPRSSSKNSPPKPKKRRRAQPRRTSKKGSREGR